MFCAYKLYIYCFHNFNDDSLILVLSINKRSYLPFSLDDVPNHRVKFLYRSFLFQKQRMIFFPFFCYVFCFCPFLDLFSCFTDVKENIYKLVTMKLPFQKVKRVVNTIKGSNKKISINYKTLSHARKSVKM